tara:strand:- start:1084 stop:1236 length:153 start_codon:yes stop_codon:yes gene_type:complete
MGNVDVLVTGVSAVAVINVVQLGEWLEIADAQSPSWDNVNNTQTADWVFV